MTSVKELGQGAIAVATNKMSFNWYKLQKTSMHFRRKQHPVTECQCFAVARIKMCII